MLKENTPAERLFNGIIRENPTLVIVLGMCPTLAVTTSAMNGIGMGLSTTVVLTLSNLFIALLRKVIPDAIRIPAFIVIIASFVTIVDMLMAGFTPDLYAQLGIYIPLIVVNCIIFGRAEAYASKNAPVAALFDGIGMGLGFTIAITILGAIREFIGAGAVFGHTIGNLPDYMPSIFVMAPGAFLVLAVMITIRAHIINTIEAKKGVRLNVTHTDEEGAVCSGCAFAVNCAGKMRPLEAAAADIKKTVAENKAAGVAVKKASEGAAAVAAAKPEAGKDSTEGAVKAAAEPEKKKAETEAGHVGEKVDEKPGKDAGEGASKAGTEAEKNDSEPAKETAGPAEKDGSAFHAETENKGGES
ncbi:MAG: electron transport complex subunit RsxE [Lachnospiraceae bacterium]|nr:electron transport complex subunit RsxE [Lachnospiraceae bacterium]